MRPEDEAASEVLTRNEHSVMVADFHNAFCAGSYDRLVAHDDALRAALGKAKGERDEAVNKANGLEISAHGYRQRAQNAEQTLADISAVSAQEPSEGTCMRCGRVHATVWFAPSPIWNRVMRRPRDDGERFGFCCSTCFMQLAEEEDAALRTTAWALLPERDLDAERDAAEAKLKKAEEESERLTLDLSTAKALYAAQIHASVVTTHERDLWISRASAAEARVEALERELRCVLVAAAALALPNKPPTDAA